MDIKEWHNEGSQNVFSIVGNAAQHAWVSFVSREHRGYARCFVDAQI